ncbi:MAG: hypothetical protein ACRDMV_00825 [Streptosporangiales bacterium]
MKVTTLARRHLPIAIGASALVLGGVLASAGSAGAADHGSQIKNYPLQQIDIGEAGVSGVKGDGQDEVQHQSIGQRDIAGSGVSGSAGDTAGEIEKGSVGGQDLSKSVNTKLNQVPDYTVANTEVRWHAGNNNESAIACAEGQVALGGGYGMSGTANGDVADVHVDANEPVYSDGMATGWHVTGSAAGDVNVKAWVICAG